MMLSAFGGLDDIDGANEDLASVPFDQARLEDAVWEERYAELKRAERDDIDYAEFMLDPEGNEPW